VAFGLKYYGAGVAVRLAAMVAVCSAAALAQQYVFQSYGQEEGLANLSAKCLLQDRDGYLWVGTENGLFRFDGARFRAFGEADGLPGTRVEGLAETQDGTFWVATQRGLSRREGDRFIPVSKKLGGTLSRSPLSAGLGGKVYASMLGGLFEGAKQEGHWRFRRLWGGQPNQSTAAVAAAPNGSVWFGCDTAICCWTNGRVDRFGPEHGVAAQRWDGLTVDGPGTVWARSAARLIYRPDGAVKFHSEKVKLPDSVESESASLGRSGQLLIPTNEGLMERRDGVWRRIGEEQGLPMENVIAAMEDREGSVWLALGGGGVARWAGYSGWEAFTRRDGLPAQTTWGMAEDRDGTVWVGTDKGVAALRRANGQWQLTRLMVQGLPEARVRQVAIDNDGSLWLGYADHGLWRVPPGRASAEPYHFNGDATRPRVMSLLLDRRGQLWVATRNGLFLGRRTGRQRNFARQTVLSGVPNKTFYGLAEDREGRIWAAGALGLAVHEAGRWRVFSPKDGLSSSYVAYLAAHPDGSIWLGYRENVGISKARLTRGQLTLRHIRAGDGLTSDQALSVAVDAHGWVWLGTDRGVSVWDGKAWRQFTSQEGLIWNDCDGAALLAAKDGTVWIGTSRGLSHLSRDGFAEPSPPAKVLFPAIVMGGRHLAPGQALQGRRGDALSVTAAVMTFKHSKRVRIRYRLLGLEDDWVVSPQREIRYASMPSGSYTLEVEAGLEGGPWSGRIERLDLVVEPAWWETWWARMAALGLMVTIVQWMIRHRIATLRAQHRRLEEAVARRTSELTEQKRRTEQEKATVERQREEIGKLLEAAQEANRLKGEFLANMSHEIRTPMNGVLGMTALALETGISGEQAQYVSMAHQSAEGLLSLLNEILDFSKIEAGRLDLDRQPFQVRAVVSEAISTLSALARTKGLDVKIEIGAGVPDTVSGDCLRLRQVLMNLAGNALKFTEKGEVGVSVSVAGRNGSGEGAAVKDGGDTLLFEVRDTGEGIAEEKLETIFEPFRQADGSTSRRHGGTGLGLAISARLVSMMGGKIGVRSRLGQGSVFYFTIPLNEAPAVDVGYAAPEGAIGGGRLEGLRVLVAEDNEVNRILIRKILEKSGCAVTQAANGAEAVDLIRAGTFDAVLMDVQMPELDGLEATRRIRAAGMTGLPIIALTAHAFQHDLQECLAAGMNAYLSKPVHAQKLRSTLAQVCGWRAAAGVRNLS